MIKTALTICFLFSASSALALPSAPMPDEIIALPAFCKAKLSPDPSDDIQYSGMIGPDWLHIHHYCFALNFTNRYYKYYDKNERRTFLKDALGNYDYMFSHATPNFWMRPEIHTQKAMLLAAAKQYAAAINDLQQALKDNPNYAPAYATLSDIYADLGQKQKSVAAVEQGLQHVPDAVPLQRRYKQLTGKTFVPPTSAEQVVQSPNPLSAGVVTPAHQEEVQNRSAAPANSGPTATSAPADTPEKIGVPGNPYCRFCP